MSPRLGDITPTILLAPGRAGPQQVVRVAITNAGPAAEALLTAERPGIRSETRVRVPAGDSTHELLIPEPAQPLTLDVSLRRGAELLDRRGIALTPPPHLRVHVVQHSHHDVGYTNLPSAVLREHCSFLDDALDMAASTAAYPTEARFRLVIEQAWSLQEFVRTAPPDRVERMGELLRRGDFELTALFGNMTTELCGPEELIRALYPSQRLARRFGCTITTAEHNDVPGMSWGLAEVLAGAGVRLFCPQLPRYWSWSDPPLQGFWDEQALFPQGLPGGFWWQAPSGRRVLLWDAYGTGGDVRPDLPGLADRLQALVDGGYPYRAVYWLVRGGARDNSPYIAEFCDTVRAWNERWAHPRLLMSTNARFHAELQTELPTDLPVFAGELPGQDYPVGSMSTSVATAVNRGNQTQLLVAERLATLAAQATDHVYPAETLDRAWEATLWYDEHTWGHHFPAGPAAEASTLEKQTHAYRAAALAQEVKVRALARIADHVALPGEGLFAVVFNPLPFPRTAPVVTPLRELDISGSVMITVTDPAEPEAPGYLRAVPLTDRWPAHPPPEIIAGQFDLIDLETGESVAFEIVELDPDSPRPHAPQRCGLGQNSRRYGFFEVASGLRRDLHFLARDIPAGGYRTYQLRPREASGTRSAVRRRPDPVIENEYYRVAADAESGRVVSVIDLETDRELLDPQAPYSLGELVVRTPDDHLPRPEPLAAPVAHAGPVCSRLDMWQSAPGHPHLRQTLTLYRGVKRLDLAVRVLKDPTPLLDAHLAFAFALREPRFRLESVLSVQTPPEDYLPGAYWDEVAVRNWVRVHGGDMTVLWASIDSPMVSLGELTAGYTSPAHSARVSDRLRHRPGTTSQLTHARLYSLLCAGNFGTNFAVSQTGSLLLRYCLTTFSGAVNDRQSVQWGEEVFMPPETILTEPRRPGNLPLSGSLISLTGDPLVTLGWKRADDGEGTILRLWNPLSTSAETTVQLGLGRLKAVVPVALTEVEATSDEGTVTRHGERCFAVRLGPRSLATLRLTFTEGTR